MKDITPSTSTELAIANPPSASEESIPLLNAINITLPPLSDKIIPFAWQEDAANELVERLTKPVVEVQKCHKVVIEQVWVGNEMKESRHKIDLAPNYLEKYRRNGVLLRAGTGTGKMYMACLTIRKLIEAGQLVKPPGSINPFVVLWLTPKSVKSQTISVVVQFGLQAYVNVMSYSEIKSSLGAMYITWLKQPNSDDLPIWNLQMLPALVKCDECQVLKNPASLQSRVVRAIPDGVKALFASATPFQRCEDATTLLERFAVRTKYNPVLPATAETSSRILQWIASPKKTHEYSPSAVERLREQLKDYIVELKNVRFKHQAHTKCVTIHFKSPAERAAYDALVKELIDGLNRRKARGEDSWIHFLVEMQKMQQGAELLRCDHIADRVLANCDSKAVIVASNFVETLRKVYRILTQERGINPERIAFIIGGQDMDERAKMVKEFQAGKRDILLFTMKSGGVGISLHHDRETTKPRHIILPPTWSAIDLVQALGRGHRLTSLSATTQEILWYGETIEDAVKLKVELKIKCLSKAVTAKEQFVDTFTQAAGVDFDSDSYAEAVETEENKGKELNNDDISSSDDNLAITGEGLEQEELEITNK